MCFKDWGRFESAPSGVGMEFYESDVALKRRRRPKRIVHHLKCLHTPKTLYDDVIEKFFFVSLRIKEQLSPTAEAVVRKLVMAKSDFRREVCGAERNAIKKFISSHNDDRKTVNRREISKKMKKGKFFVSTSTTLVVIAVIFLSISPERYNGGSREAFCRVIS